MPTIINKQTPKPGPKKSGGSVLDRITPIGFEDQHGIKILIYGKSGSGKTTCWATFPGPILVALCSGGEQPGELRSVDTPAYRKKISQVVLQESKDLFAIIKHVKETKKFQTVVLDHASGLQDLTLKEILGVDDLPAQKGWGMATRTQYGTSGLQCKELFRALLSLDCNVVIVAQERQFGGDDEENELIAPTIGAALSPSTVAWLNPACDYVVQTYLRPKVVETTSKVAGKEVTTKSRGSGIEYCLRTGPHEVYMTKFRMPKSDTPLPECIVDPDYDKIISLIQGGNDH